MEIPSRLSSSVQFVPNLIDLAFNAPANSTRYTQRRRRRLLLAKNNQYSQPVAA